MAVELCSQNGPEAPDDRALQDDIIRYLAEAHSRSQPQGVSFLDPDEVEKAQRFSRFLARRYYRDRLQRGFRYSSLLVSPPKSAEWSVESPDFETVFATCALGSIATAKQVGTIAVTRLLPLRSDEWWSELLEYEFAFFVQLAASEPTFSESLPKKSASALVQDFCFNIPDLVSRLKAGESFTTDLSSPRTLLFSRTSHGRIYVVELDAISRTVFFAVDGASTVHQLAVKCSTSVDEIRRIFSIFQDIGAVSAGWLRRSALRPGEPAGIQQ